MAPPILRVSLWWPFYFRQVSDEWWTLVELPFHMAVRSISYRELYWSFWSLVRVYSKESMH